MSAGILLIGFGRRGRQWRAAVGARRGCHLAGIVDPDDGARAVAEAEGLAAWASVDAALAATSADAAILATPPAKHAAHALACLGAGLGVLVEKPLALSVEDAVAVADAADAAGRPAVVGHNFRHRALERALRRALAAGDIGELRVAAIATARPTPPTRSDAPDHPALWDIAVHHLDLLRLRAGGPPDAVESRAVPSAGGVTYSLRLEWDSGIAADYWLREGASVYHHAEWLEGTRGALRSVDGRAWLVTPARRPRRLRRPRGPSPERVLLDALLGGDASGVDARECLGTIATVEAATRSLALERWVRLDEVQSASAGVAP